MIASHLAIKIADKQEVLEVTTISERLELAFETTLGGRTMAVVPAHWNSGSSRIPHQGHLILSISVRCLPPPLL